MHYQAKFKTTLVDQVSSNQFTTKTQQVLQALVARSYLLESRNLLNLRTQSSDCGVEKIEKIKMIVTKRQRLRKTESGQKDRLIVATYSPLARHLDCRASQSRVNTI